MFSLKELLKAHFVHLQGISQQIDVTFLPPWASALHRTTVHKHTTIAHVTVGAISKNDTILDSKRTIANGGLQLGKSLNFRTVHF
jgi:hypothetical protein